MSYTEFLDTVKVLKMLFGRQIAEKFFTENAQQYTMLNNVSINKMKRD